MTMVCATDGVVVVQSRTDRWVHTDEIPKGVDPDHEIVVITREEHTAHQDRRTWLRSAAEDMILHHGTLHPLADCEWAQRLLVAIRQA